MKAKPAESLAGSVDEESAPQEEVSEGESVADNETTEELEPETYPEPEPEPEYLMPQQYRPSERTDDNPAGIQANPFFD